MAGGANPPPIHPIPPSIQREIVPVSSASASLNAGLEEFPLLPRSKTTSAINGVSNPGSAGNQSWKSLLNNQARASSETTKLAYDGPKNFNGVPIAFFSSDELKPHIDLNESLVVGYFVGKRSDFTFVKENLTAQWKTKGDFEMTIYGEQAFMFRFSQEEDRTRILEMGSVFIASKLFLIRPWSPFIEQHIGAIKTVPVWMLIRDLPIHLWNATGFARICSLIGTPIMTDTPTALKTRMSFARVCVEIDSTCTFPSELPYQIDDKKYKVRVEYPWKPTLCSLCKSFGHSSAKCGSNPAPKYKKKWVPKISNAAKATTEAHETSAGETIEATTTLRQDLELGTQSKDVAPSTENWTVYTTKKKKSSRKGSSQAQPCSPNRFSVLDTDTENVSVELDESLTGSRQEGIKEQEGNKEVSDDKVTIETCDDSSEESEYETDNEDMAVEKMRNLEEIPTRRPMTKEQKVDNLVNVSALLGVGGKKADMKNIFGDIVERQSKLNPEKELAKLNWPGVTNNDMLGRGKRTPAKKK